MGIRLSEGLHLECGKCHTDSTPRKPCVQLSFEVLKRSYGYRVLELRNP